MEPKSNATEGKNIHKKPPLESKNIDSDTQEIVTGSSTSTRP